MQRLDVGPRLNQFAYAAPTIGFTPLYDRAALVRRIGITNVSAADDWTVTVGGREIMRIRVLTNGNQRPLQLPTTGTAYQPNFFEYCRIALGKDPAIPVPQGQTMTVASVGGATANIVLGFEEVDPSDAANVGSVNHYLGQNFLMPWFGRVNASVTAVGQANIDTETRPPWVPTIMSGAVVPGGWEIDILALFLEGGGVNTFSGAANHQSTTSDVRMQRDGVQLFSRSTTGLANLGTASAAGSANTVIAQNATMYPPFQLANDNVDSLLTPPLMLRPGDNIQAQLNITGDVTGGANYAPFLICAIANVRRVV